MPADNPRFLVSVAIPTYNHARFLGEAIESVLAQGDIPTEIIVVDDGSTDDPAAVVRRYPGVRLIRQENAGLAAARNTGWRNASGRYVVFLDADDRLLPNALSVNLRKFEQSPRYGFVYAGYRVIDVDGRVNRLGPFIEIGADPFATLLRGNAIGMHATVMYRRDVLEKTGGFDPHLAACEDYDLCLRISRNHPVGFSRDYIADYRMHEGNMSRDLSFMLHWALTALMKQWPQVTGQSRYLAAYRDGVRAWRYIYAKQQLHRIRRDRRLASIRDFVRITRQAPATMLRLIAAAVARRLLLRR